MQGALTSQEFWEWIRACLFQLATPHTLIDKANEHTLKCRGSFKGLALAAGQFHIVLTMGSLAEQWLRRRTAGTSGGRCMCAQACGAGICISRQGSADVTSFILSACLRCMSRVIHDHP